MKRWDCTHSLHPTPIENISLPTFMEKKAKKRRKAMSHQ